MSTMERDRRRFLAEVATMIGLAALPAEALLAAPNQTHTLDKPTMALIAAVADTLVPRTDTPGAVQAGVPETFARLLHDWAKPQSAAELMAALSALDDAAKAETGKPFAQLPGKQRSAFLTRYDAARFRADKSYLKLKMLLLSLFYMSEPGATRDLRFEQVPGIWQASIPLTSQTRTWAA